VTEAPHPRVLFEDIPDDLYKELAPLVGTSKRIENDDPVHASDWDLVVTFAWDAGAREVSLHMLSFGAHTLDPVQRGGRAVSLNRSNTTRARGGAVAHGVPAPLAGLLRRTVIENIGPEEKETWGLFWGYHFDDRDDALTDDLGGACVPLVHVGRERYVYALRRERSQDHDPPTLCWALPPETTGQREWLLHVLGELRVHDPHRFPSDPEWQTHEVWATPALREAMRRRAVFEAEWVAAQAEFDRRRGELTAEIDTEAEAAAGGMWRLLTSQGDDLVGAVADCLRDLGFTVQDMDDHHDEVTGARLEDLRVTDLDEPGWECLGEVKGYTKGARVNDVPQVTMRPSVNYAAERGHPPSSVWHIVNTFLDTDPSARPPSVPADSDLQPLTDANGALIDTRDLFGAWRDVIEGRVGAGDVRGSLREARTRWTPTPVQGLETTAS